MEEKATQLVTSQGTAPDLGAGTRVVISGFDLPLDVTDLYKYERWVRELSQLTTYTGPMFMQELLEAFNIASHLAARVVHEYELARDNAKRARAIAHLEAGPQWLIAQGRKVTESACEQYVEMDADYIKAREREAYLKALLELLENKIQYFRSAHDDAKRIYSLTTNPMGGSVGAPSGN